MARLEDLPADALDQCGEYSPRGNRCSKEADHGGQHSFEEAIPVGPVIHCPFDAGHDNGTYGGGWD
jgi:hypothetical protein